MKENILENWYNSLKWDSSNLNPYRSLDRQQLDFIYHIFLSFYGDNYFDIKSNNFTSENNSYWIYFLLINNQKNSSFQALKDIAENIDYAIRLGGDFLKRVNSFKKNQSQMRDFLFEIFIYKLLDKSGIYNIKNNYINNRQREGVLRINGIDYLFECRKVYVINKSQIDFRKRLLDQIYLNSVKCKKGIGYLLTVSFKNQLINHKEFLVFEKKISQFYSKLNNLESVSRIDYHDESNEGVLKVIDYNETDAINIHSDNSIQVRLVVRPPEKQIENVLGNYSHELSSNFQISQNDIYKKVKEVLKEKKKQMKNSNYSNNIIFLDFESVVGIDLSLFSSQRKWDEERLNDIRRSLNMDHTICFIIRDYTGNKYESHVLIISSVSDPLFKKALTDMFESQK
ncbi:MAG: hypothetical protein IM638_11810 [Bacteroidetes bacterium]|nr:hypothetical protein [Bacteroidota bacterium]